MDVSPAESSAAAANKKRKRISRACDACFSKKDRCDGAQPICKVCKNLGRPCTYNRPERKRGPSQGVRQRLEGQIESLESILGYIVDTYPQLSSEAAKHLRLDEAEDILTNSSRIFFAGFNTPSPSSPASTQSGNIYPHYSKVDARELWRVSNLAKAVAPSLSLNLGTEDDDDELNGYDGWRSRIEEARRARARLRSGVTASSPVLSSMQMAAHQHQHQHQQHQQQHQLQHQNHPSHPLQHQYPHAPPPASTHYNHYPHSTQPAPPPNQYPSPSQHYSSKRPQQARPPAGYVPSPSRPPAFMSETGHHSYSQFPPPPHNIGQQQRSMEPQFSSPTHAPPPVENYNQQGNSSFDGETDALAYALGLTSYTASPQADNFGPRPSGMVQQSWLPNASTSSEQHSSQAFHPMHSLDQQQSSSSQEDNASASLTFFSDLDLNLGNQASNNHNMSILHQLGLQGSLDMPTPVNTGNDHIDSSNPPPAAGASGSSSGGNNNNNHHTPNQWLQPIRGIN